MNLGNCYHLLQLRCTHCGWAPPPGMRMDHTQLHFSVEHDSGQVRMDLVPVCPCGAVMERTSVSPTGGGAKLWQRCPSCGNTGHLVQRDQGVPGT